MSGCGDLTLFGPPSGAGSTDRYTPGADARHSCEVSVSGHVTTPDGAGKSGVAVLILYPGGINIAGSVQTDSTGFYVTGPQPAFSTDPEKVAFRLGGYEHTVSLPKYQSCTHHEIDLTWIW